MRPRADSLYVWTGAPCSYGCAACPIDAGTAAAGLQVDAVQRALSALPARRGRLVVLLGGEPFLRPDFLALVAAIRAAGAAPGLITSGRPMVYPQLRARLRRAGLAYLRIQLFGTGAAHDQATAVPDAFAQALAGLRAWLGEADPSCAVDAALSTRGRAPAALVADVEALAGALGDADVQIALAVDPDADAAPLRPALAALARWNDDAARPLLAWEGLPAALAPLAALAVAPPRPAVLGPAPAACCLGRGAGLARAAAGGELETRANSFNFIRSARAVPYRASAAACEAHAATDGVAPARHVWLVDGAELSRYDTDTGDFDGAEIARIKDAWSHLFLDRAPAGVLDDFIEGMRRLLPDPTCAGCAQQARCGHRYQVVDAPPFAREEAWIAAFVARLRGRVLDVGCGEQLYRDALAPLVRSGAVHYSGLDPDVPSLERLRAALGGGRFHRGGIEDFWDEPDSYDTILCLRSLNHVFDVDEAVARMAALLRPGGQLLIVETTPFAMLRRAEQVAAADQAPRAGHQHFRNLTSTEVLPFARRRGLRVRAHHPAGLATSNEWILLLERPRPGAS